MGIEKDIQIARRWVKVGGFVNALLALPFGLPFTYKWYTEGWIKLNEILGLGGQKWEIPTDGAGVMFMVLGGLGLHLVGITLLYASRDLKNRLGVPLLNGIVRIVFVFVGSYQILKLNGTPILFSFVFIDIILGPALLYQSLKVRKKLKESTEN